MITRVTAGELLVIMAAFREDAGAIRMPPGRQSVVDHYDDIMNLLQDVIGASHMGCAADTVLIDLQDGTL